MRVIVPALEYNFGAPIYVESIAQRHSSQNSIHYVYSISVALFIYIHYKYTTYYTYGVYITHIRNSHQMIINP